MDSPALKALALNSRGTLELFDNYADCMKLVINFAFCKVDRTPFESTDTEK